MKVKNLRRQNFNMAEDTRENDIALTHLHIQKKGTEACVGPLIYRIT